MVQQLGMSKTSKFMIGLAAAVAMTLVVWTVTQKFEYVPLTFWDTFAACLLLLAWRDFHGKTAAQTAAMARKDYMGQSATDIVLTIASLASIGVVVLLLASSDSSPLHIVFGLASIVLSWATVHVLYMTRYAVMYYDDKKDGIDFNGIEDPTFVDFAYIAFTMGMTYQVSDTAFTSTRFRKVALTHALLSFVFGTAIIATTINFLASLSK